MYFDFKKTIWERVTVAEEDEEMILEAIKSGKITTGSEIFGLVTNNEVVNYENIDDTEEYLSPDENYGGATIDVRNDGGETIWHNGER